MNHSLRFIVLIGLAIGCVGCRSAHRPSSQLGFAKTCGLMTQVPAIAKTGATPKLLSNRAEKTTVALSPKSTSKSGSQSKVIAASYNRQAETGLELETEPTGMSVDATESLIPSVSDCATSIGNAMAMPFTSGVSVDGMTLGAAEEFAVANNPDLLKAQAAVESLRGQHLQVGLKPNPQVGYLSADVGEEGTAGQQGGFFSQEFIRGGKLQLNRAIVCRQIKAAQQQLEIDRQRLLTDVRQRFYDLLVAQEKMATVQKFDQLARAIADTSEKLFQEEEISKIANLRSQLQLKNIGVVVEQTENELKGAQRRFVATTGLGTLNQFDTETPFVSGQVRPETYVSDARGSIDLILTGSPELAKAAEELEAVKWNLNRQIAEPTRNVQVQAGFTHGNVTGEDLVALQVGVPLRINDRNQGNIASARSEVNKAAQNIGSIERDLAKRFSVAWRDYENARIQSEKFDSEILPAASEFYDLVESAYREGEQDYLDLVSAQQTYLDASLQSLDAIREFWRAASLIDGYLLSQD